jgi:NAD(P)-dependent dehydrogenase (short-subunit alcohol dehydrogenase family)
MHATNLNDSIHHFHRDEVLVTTVALELGGIDILVNNAVNSVPGAFLELSDKA